MPKSVPRRHRKGHWKTWLLEMRIGSSTITTRVMQFPQGEDPLEQAKIDLCLKKCLLCCFWELRHEKLEDLDWDTVYHFPWCCSSECHSICPLMNSLRKDFIKVEDTESTEKAFFDIHSLLLWEKRIADLPIRRETVVFNGGGYTVQ